MSIKIDGNEFLSAREASEIFSYSSDYVAKLCRENLVVSKKISAKIAENLNLKINNEPSVKENKNKNNLWKRISE